MSEVLAQLEKKGGDSGVSFDGYACIRSNNQPKKQNIVAGSNTINTADGTARAIVVMMGKNIDTITLPNNVGAFGYKKDGTVENSAGQTINADDYICVIPTNGQTSFSFSATLK